MVAESGNSYVQSMTSSTIRIAHPELCDHCHQLLPSGSVVLVDAGLHVSCARCAGDDVDLPVADPWAWVHDPALRDRLQHRHDADRVLVGA
jgi:hypothetical protein